MITRHLYVILSAVAAVGFAPQAIADDWITVAQSQPFVVASAKVQHLSENISVPKGQEKLQLYLTYYNGTDKTPSFKWLRIASPSMNYVSEQQFEGKKALTLDVSGELTWSDNQILISGAGPMGATFQWALRTPKPTVTGVSTSSAYSGSSITITGTNFCPSPSADQVTIGSQPARIVSATPTQIVVEIPEESKGGQTPITVNIAGIPAVAPDVNINVIAQPYLKSLSADFVAPGETVTINGEGFSADATKDAVYIGQFRAPIVSASENSLTVTAPGQLSDAWYSPWVMGNGAFYPIKVIVNGVKSRNSLTIRAGDVG